MVQFSHPYMTTGKIIAFTRWTFVCKLMSLLFSMLSRFVIGFLPRSKCLLNSWLQSPSTVILDLKQIRSVTVSIFSPFIFYEVMGSDAMILVFWMLSFNPGLSLSSFTLIRNLFSYSSLSVISVVLPAYLRFFNTSPGNLDSSLSFIQLTFCIMYFSYKLNNLVNNIQPWYTPLPIWSQSVVPHPVLTIASWPAYRCSGIPISLKIFHSLLLSTQTMALVWSMKQKYMFFWNSLAFSMIQQMLAIWSPVPLPSHLACTSGSSPSHTVED